VPAEEHIPERSGGRRRRDGLTEGVALVAIALVTTVLLAVAIGPGPLGNVL
jgi:hypothetical protein